MQTINNSDLGDILRFREAVCAAQRANADAMYLASLLTRADLYSDASVRVVGLTIDRDALMAANRSLDQTNGILLAIAERQGCLV